VTPSDLVVVGFGPVTSYKYSRMIADAVRSGVVDSYSVVDLESQRRVIDGRLSPMAIPPEEVLLLPDASAVQKTGSISPEFDRWLGQKLENPGKRVRVFIATEPQAHESYLRYCIQRGVDSLTTKPLVLPMRDGWFAPDELLAQTTAIANLAREYGGSHEVLCLGRHHEVYEYGVRRPVQRLIDRLGVPVTSVHLKTASGVWNLPHEFGSRDDHPYRYGYGMLMHGAYHYVDILTRILLLNRRILPTEPLTLHVVSYGAWPVDQSCRIPSPLSEGLANHHTALERFPSDHAFGETDVVSVFRLCLNDGQTLTVGTLALEQTTPGMRSWGPFPVVPYNINGRLHSTELDVRLSVAYGVCGRVVKVPLGGRRDTEDLRARNLGQVITRANAVLLDEQEFYTEQRLERAYGDSFSFRAERAIFREWLEGRPGYSDVESHIPTAAVTQALAESLGNPGSEIVIPLPYEEPLWPADAIVDVYGF
jgi:predicted dehydrogenase